MSEASTMRRHVAIFANPEHARALPVLAVVEELVERDYRVTYVTSSEVASRFALSGATDGRWDVVGCLDDTDEPVAVVLGYFEDDVPDLVVHDASAGAVARTCARGWGLFADTNRDGRLFDDEFDQFVSRSGFVVVPEQLREPSASHLARR
ncbi:hypothetical protein Lesp02_12000 [Lentzea sp. NBRC 105346]|nr:hypothetical protein Lesp02_12000 [Lentzea sp. NBRC 105346]